MSESTSPPHLASRSLAATPAPAPTKPATPSSSRLSPHATPFFPSSFGRSKAQRWAESPRSDGDATGELKIHRPSYRDVVAGEPSPAPGWTARQPRTAATPPSQPPRIHVRSQIHRVSDAAPDEEGWRTVRSRRVHRRHRRPQIQHDFQTGRKSIPASLEGRCFNCLGKGHLRRTCREPTRCMRCKKPGHRSFECRRPDLRHTRPPPSSATVRAHKPRQRVETGEEPTSSSAVVGGSAPSQCRWPDTRHSRPLPFLSGGIVQAKPRQRVVAGGIPISSSAAGGGSTSGGHQQQQHQDRTRGRRRRRGCRGGGRRKRQAMDSAPDRPDRSLSPSSPSPKRRRDDPDLCFIDRTEDIDQREAEYEYLGILVQISGTRPPVSLEQAKTAIANQCGIPLDERLQIHPAMPPYDFLLIAPDHGAYLAVLAGDRMIQTPAFTLLVRPWHRLVYADYAALYHKVQIDIVGIPPHVWRRSTAATLLGSYCSIDHVHPDTLARRNLSTFTLTAWTTRPERIPESRTLCVPEPFDAESLLQPMRRTLRYPVHIHVRRLLVRFPPESPPPSPPPTPPSSESSEEESPERDPKRSRKPRRSRRHRKMDTPPTPAAEGELLHHHGRHGQGAQLDHHCPADEQAPPTADATIMATGTVAVTETVMHLPLLENQSGCQTSSPTPQRSTKGAINEDLQLTAGSQSDQRREEPRREDPMLLEFQVMRAANPTPLPFRPVGCASADLEIRPTTNAPPGVAVDQPAQNEQPSERPVDAINGVSVAAEPGTEETMLLPPDNDEEASAPTSLPAQQFLEEITTPAPAMEPMLSPTPNCRPRNARSLRTATSVRRSRRIAACGITGTAVGRAQTVLMRKLGILQADQGLSQEARDAYAQLFEHPLSRPQLTALASIFGWTVPNSFEARSADLLVI